MSKKLIMLLVSSMLLVGNAHAGLESVAGVKADAPNLLKISDKLSLGLEVSKDMIHNIGYSDVSYVEDDKGYSGYVKVTYTGSLLDFSKK